MKTLSATHGIITIVDDVDYPELSKHRWRAIKSGHRWYVVRDSPRANGKRRVIYMHCEIMGSRPRLEIDHITHEGEEDGIIDNRRENLRFCTHAQNNANQRKAVGCSSQFRGVTKTERGWQSQIRENGRVKYLGLFKSEEEAARAYDAAARRIYGEFAESFVNFPLKS